MYGVGGGVEGPARARAAAEFECGGWQVVCRLLMYGVGGGVKVPVQACAAAQCEWSGVVGVWLPGGGSGGGGVERACLSLYGS